MAILSTIISLFFLIITGYSYRKEKTISPIVVFFGLWFFIMLLSMANLYGIIRPSDEAFFLIILMLICFFLGYLLNYIIKKKYKDINKELNKKEKNEIQFEIRYVIYYILNFCIILFNIIDIIIIIKLILEGNVMWQIRNWTLEPFGSSNPILSRRSFVEELFRSLILTPFATIIPPITAFVFFASDDNKKKYKMLITSLIVMITSSMAGGGGRLEFVYYIGSFLLAFIVISSSKNISKDKIKKYKKAILIFLAIGIIFVGLCTIFRVGIENIIKQVYTYFALPPTLLSIWLPDIKQVEYTYGMTTFFGIHSYFFRVLETVGLESMVPQIYNEAYRHILNAEIFKDVGYGVANAFVTPIYYFFIDGGYPFVCIFSFVFGYILSYIYDRIKKDINIRSFVIYTLVTYGMFLTFIRIQTAVPAYFISLAFSFFIFKKKKTDLKENDDKEICKKNELKSTELISTELISIIIPIYMVEECLEKCVDSVINQSYKNLEIILVDDGSPDKCGEICDEYANKDNRIKVIHKKNGGLSDARNVGIDNSTGSYITFIDSDDYVDENYVEELYNVIKLDDTDMAIGAHRVIYDNCTTIDKSTNEVSVLTPETVLERILYDEGIDLSAWSKLYKKELFKKVRYPKGRLFEDAATTYKLIDESKKISLNSKPIYNYIIRNNSITGKEFSNKKMDLILSTEEMTNYIKNKYPKLEKAAERRLLYAYLSTLSQLAMTKEKFPKEQEILMNYIKNKRFDALKDRRIPNRDKVALISTIFGFNIFKFIWSIYRKYTGRQ